MYMEKTQTTLFLIRHAQPMPRDPRHLYDPAIDHPRKLTKIGEEQAQLDGKYLADFPITAIYSSPVERCYQTAQIIKEEIKSNSEIIIDKGLTEVYPSHSDIISGRGEHSIKKIIASHSGEDVICVTHRFVVGSVLMDIFGKSDWSEVPCDTGDIYQVVFANKKMVSASRLQPWRKET
jgi:broad specificity phosphatase PhoE